jgi:hypothetical protein
LPASRAPRDSPCCCRSPTARQKKAAHERNHPGRRRRSLHPRGRQPSPRTAGPRRAGCLRCANIMAMGRCG